VLGGRAFLLHYGAPMPRAAMLTKNANPKQPSTGEPPPYPANEFLARVSAHELSVKRLVEKVAADFRVLAKVPKPEAVVDPLARENLLDEYYLESFLRGLLEDCMDLRADEQCAVPSDIISLLDNTKHDAVILQQQIEKLHSTLEERIKSDVEARLAFGSEAMRMIVIDAIDRVRDSLGLPRDMTIKRSKRRGRRPLPESLKFLVAEMEYLALTLGSKGFGLPTTTRPQKGRIIQMLDRLRKHLTNDPELVLLAEFLPAPGAHPVSVYQDAIKRSRTQGRDLESAEE
jgi:hypothetical protein